MGQTFITHWSKQALLLDTQANTFTTYPGQSQIQGRKMHGSAVVKLLDKTKAVILLRGLTAVNVHPHPEISVIDPENGIFGPWKIDKSLELLQKYGTGRAVVCANKNERAFCFYTVAHNGQEYIQEFIPWLIPQWRVHKVTTKSKSSLAANEIVIWEA